MASRFKIGQFVRAEVQAENGFGELIGKIVNIGLDDRGEYYCVELRAPDPHLFIMESSRLKPVLTRWQKWLMLLAILAIVFHVIMLMAGRWQ